MKLQRLYAVLGVVVVAVAAIGMKTLAEMDVSEVLREPDPLLSLLGVAMYSVATGVDIMLALLGGVFIHKGLKR